MTGLLRVFLLLGLLAFAAAEIDLEYPPSTIPFNTRVIYHEIKFGAINMGAVPAYTGFNSQQSSGDVTGFLNNQCQWDYWRLDAAASWGSDLGKADYLNVNITTVNGETTGNSFDAADVEFYIAWSLDGQRLPTEDDFDWKVTVNALSTFNLNAQFLELMPCEMHADGYYWFGLRLADGYNLGDNEVDYTFVVNRRRALGASVDNLYTFNDPAAPAQITPIPLNTPVFGVRESRPYAGPPGIWGDQGNQANQDRVLQWRFFSIDVSGVTFSEGSYLVVNVSGVRNEDGSGYVDEFRVAMNFGNVPYYANNYLDDQVNPEGDSPSSCSIDACYNVGAGTSYNDCLSGVDPYECGVYPGNWSTTTMIVGPCTFTYDLDVVDETSNNLWYVGILLPESTYDIINDEEVTTFTTYQILATIVSPTVTALELATPTRGLANLPNPKLPIYDNAVHYKFSLTTDQVGEFTNLEVRTYHIRGHSLQTALRRYEGPGTNFPDYSLAYDANNGSPYSGCNCYPDLDYVCIGCVDCQIVVNWCQLVAGDYYLSVRYAGADGAVVPVDFTVEANLFETPAPLPLVAGTPVFGSVESRHYDFYALYVPPSLEDTWLFVELFSRMTVAGSTGSVQLLANELPGETCYPEGDYLCQVFGGDEGSQGSCNFIVDSCHLRGFESNVTDAYLYLSVYAVPYVMDYKFAIAEDVVPGNNYLLPFVYTLWAEFETPWRLTPSVTYSDVARPGQYNHYYFYAENHLEGSWLTVEVDNIQYSSSGLHLNAYLNYNALAGECPCYESLYNCTGPEDVGCSASASPSCGNPNYPANYDLSLVTYSYGSGDQEGERDCCKLTVDACSFRDGLWYVSVLATSDSGFEGTGFVGYTVTANFHAAPVVKQFPLKVPLVDTVAPNAINHYQVAGAPLSGSNLVLSLTWMQDECGRADGYEITDQYPVDQLTTNGKLELRVEFDHLALPECYAFPFSCYANRESFSSCTVIVPDCIWNRGDIINTLVSVEYVPGDGYPAQFTLIATVETDPVTTLTPGEWYTANIQENRYQHYVLPFNSDLYGDYRLIVDYYIDSDRTEVNNQPVLSLEFDNLAQGERGDFACVDCSRDKKFYCTTSYCHFDFDPCYFQQWTVKNSLSFSVYSPYSDFFHLNSVYSLKVWFEPQVTDLELNSVISASVGGPQLHGTDAISDDGYLLRDQRHFRLTVDTEPEETEYLVVTFKALSSDANLRAYYNFDGLAGFCPCYSSLDDRSVTDTGCPTEELSFLIPPCEYTVGQYYFNVIADPADTTSEQQFQVLTATYSSPITDFGTLTDVLSSGSASPIHLGINDFTFDFDLYIDEWFAPATWNAQTSRYNVAVSQAASVLHYTFAADPTAIVYYAAYNLIQPACDITIDAVDIYYNSNNGPYYIVPSYSGCQNDCNVETLTPICSLEVDQDPSIPCGGTLARCAVTSTDNYISFYARFPDQPAGTTPNPSLSYDYGIGSATFDFKLWVQNPYVLPEDSLQNVTYYFGGNQEFQLNNVNIGGVAPITQVYFYNVQYPITVFFRPAKVPGAGGSCPDNICYDSSCVESHGGYPVTNDDVFVNNFDIPADLQVFGRSCGGPGRHFCTFSLMPCALKSSSATTWYVSVFSDSDHSDTHYAYEISWNNIGDVASTIIPFPQNYIDERARYPGPEPPLTGPEEFIAVTGLDDYVFWRVDISGISNSLNSGNSTRDNSDYTRLEIQITTADLATTVPTAPVAIFIAKGVPVPGDANAVIQQYGMPPVPALQAPLATGASILGTACEAECGYSEVYKCYGTAGCDSDDDRFVVPACCLSDGTYWIVARLTAPGDIGVGIRVRLVEEKIGSDLATFVDSTQFTNDITTPDDAVALFFLEGLTNTASGIEPDNYVHYYTTLSENQFYIDTTTPPTRWALIFNLTIDDDVTAERQAGNVHLYVRRGTRAGQNEYNHGIGFSEDNCLRSTYFCEVSLDGQYCVIEIPSAELAADDWYFSLYNDAWYESYALGLKDPTDSSTGSDNAYYDYLGYYLEIYLRPEALNDVGDRVSVITGDDSVDGFCLNQTENGLSPSISGTSSDGTYIHYSFELTEEALTRCHDGSSSFYCTFEKTLVLQIANELVTGVTYPAPTNLVAYLSYPKTTTTSGNVFEQASQPGDSFASGFYLTPSNFADEYDFVSQADGSWNINLGFELTLHGTVCPTDFYNTFAVRPGVYYISILSFQSRDIGICGYLQHPVYTDISTFTALTPSETNDETASIVSSFSYSNNDFVFDNTDPSDFFVTFTLPDSFVDQFSYLDINVTDIIHCTAADTCTPPTGFDNDFYIEVWRDDCSRWTCDDSTDDGDCSGLFGYEVDTTTGSFTSFGDFRRVIIHGASLSPCSLQSGQYYIHVRNTFGFYDFNIEIHARKALHTIAAFDTPIVSQIWQWQYQIYELPYTASLGRSITATLSDVSCGTLSLFAKYGTPAGPNPNAFLYDRVNSIDSPSHETCETCSSAWCNTDTSVNTCNIFLDICETTQYAASWFFTVYGDDQTLTFVNDLESPITYNLEFSTLSFQFNDANAIGCPQVLTYDVALPACADSEPDANLPPQQFVFKHELAPIFSSVRFTLDGPTPHQMVLSQNKPVPFFFSTSFDDSEQIGCNDGFGCSSTTDIYLDSSDSNSCIADAVESNPCQYFDGPTEFYLWVEGPADVTTVTMERWIPYIPEVYPGIVYSGTSYTYRDDYPFRYNYQYYHVNGLSTPNSASTSPYFYLTSLNYGAIEVEYIQQTGSNCFDTIGGNFYDYPGYNFLDVDTDFILIYSDDEDCTAPCTAVQYSFEIVNEFAVTAIDCNTFECVSSNIDDELLDYDASSNVFALNPATYEIAYARDSVFSSRVVTFVWDLVEPDNDSDIEWSLGSLGSCDTDNSLYSSSAKFICPLDEDFVFSIYSTDGADPAYTEYFDYRLGAYCDDLPITDVTTPVTTTGFTSPVHTEPLFVYSFDLSAPATLEFRQLLVSLDVSCGEADYYLSFDGPSDDTCESRSSCSLSPFVYYYTVICSEEPCSWVFNAELVQLPNTQLTLNAKSDLFAIDSESLNVFYFDVTEADIAIDSFIQVEILSTQANTDAPFDVSINYYGDAYQEVYLTSCCGLGLPGSGFFLEDGSTLDSSVGTTNVLSVPHCQVSAGRYYVFVRDNGASCDAHPTQFSLRPLILSHNIEVLPLAASVTSSIYSSYSEVESNFYSAVAPADSVYGIFALSNVVGGDLTLAVQVLSLPYGVNSFGTLIPEIQSPFQNIYDRSNCDGGCGILDSCNTRLAADSDEYSPQNLGCGSCAIPVTCDWLASATYYLAVTSANSVQFQAYVPIDYTLTFSSFTEFAPILPGETTSLVTFSSNVFSPRSSFAYGNFEYHFYHISLDSSLLSVRLDVAVNPVAGPSGPQSGAYVYFSDSACDLLSTTPTWCSADYAGYVCSIEIPTLAQSHFSTEYYIAVYGRYGSFTVTYTTGLDNCAVPPADELAFCADYVDYATWAVSDYSLFDNEAACRYANLVDRFSREDTSYSGCSVTPCWTGISYDCDIALRRFSCFESFRPCDKAGFITGTCTEYCEHVESTCDIAFSSVGLQEYDCGSARYLDQKTEVCNGI